MGTLKSSDVVVKLKFRLNKGDTNYYENLTPTHIEEVCNKGILDWCRTQLHGGNIYREGKENTIYRIDDLQFLITPRILSFTSDKEYAETIKLPKDYFAYSTIRLLVEKDGCTKNIDIDLVENGNVFTLLNDWSNQPSFDFEECKVTITENKIQVFHGNDFKVKEIKLYYYRLPNKIKVVGSYNSNNSNINTVDSVWEFKDDVCEVIIDYIASIQAADIESLNQKQITEQRAEKAN
jgi:hypothetical protein